VGESIENGSHRSDVEGDIAYVESIEHERSEMGGRSLKTGSMVETNATRLSFRISYAEGKYSDSINYKCILKTHRLRNLSMSKA
jgi:hypothetical protein